MIPLQEPELAVKEAQRAPWRNLAIAASLFHRTGGQPQPRSSGL